MTTGTYFFLKNEELYQVIQVTEKAIKCEPTEYSDRKKSFWLPLSGMIKQPRHPMLSETSPDTYKLKPWVKF